MSKRTLVLMILDGWGLRAAAEYNAPLQAQTPHFDRYWANCPRATLTASGEAVGLPEGQIGNSEVGHLNLGAGRVVMQTLPRVDAAFAQGKVTQIPAFQDFVRRVKAGGGRAHLLGLVSPGGVHAQQRHLSALANLLHQAGLEVLIHAVTDGRDSAPNIALSCLESFAARRASGENRLDYRPLLRHGSGPALGTHGAGLSSDSEGRGRGRSLR